MAYLDITTELQQAGLPPHSAIALGAQLQPLVSGAGIYPSFNRVPGSADNASLGFGANSAWQYNGQVFRPIVAPTSAEATWGVETVQGGEAYSVLGSAATKFAGGTRQMVPGFTGPAVTVRVTVSASPVDLDINILAGGAFDVSALRAHMAKADAGTYALCIKVYDQSGNSNHLTVPTGGTALLIVWDTVLKAYAITGSDTTRCLWWDQSMTVNRQSFSLFMYGRGINNTTDSNTAKVITLGDWLGGTAGTYPYAHVAQEIADVSFATACTVQMANNPTGGPRPAVPNVVADCGPCLFGMTSSAAATTFFSNDREGTSNPTANNAALLGGYVGTDTGPAVSTRFLSFRILGIAVCNVAATATQLKSIRSGAYASMGIRPQTPHVVAFAGDSRAAGLKTLTRGTPGAFLAEQLKSEAKVYNIAHGGYTVAQVIANQIPSLANLGITGGKKVYVSIVDVNDFIVSGSTPAQVLAAKQAEYAAVKALGWKVVGVYGFATTTSTNSANTNMVALRALITAAGAAGMGADELIDVGVLTSVSTPSNTAYYPDGLHQSEALNVAIIGLVQPAVDRQILAA